jgi:hypothetical protein
LQFLEYLEDLFQGRAQIEFVFAINDLVGKPLLELVLGDPEGVDLPDEDDDLRDPKESSRL